eukprot:30027_1
MTSSATKNDVINNPMLMKQSNPNNPFLTLKEASNLPNYTNPTNHTKITTDYSLNKDAYAENTLLNLNKGTASSISTSFNIIKGIMGVGLLTLPWSISNIGLIPSFILVIISFILSYIPWIMLCLLCQQYHVYTYRDIGSIIFGNKFAIALDIILLIFLYLVCILYVVFLSQFI